MQAQPHPPGNDADTARSRAHHRAERSSERGDPRAWPPASNLDTDDGEGERPVDSERHVVAAHRSSRNQPRASHRNNTTDRPGCEARLGSVRTLNEGWAQEARESDA